MKNILKIYKKDLKDIFTNWVVLVIIAGLAILPSLYAWFNIKASWDPYGNTKNISVAVVNKDKGYEVFDKKVNIGDDLVDELKDNENLGWKFTNEKDALDGVKKGTYYACLEIPENFSKDLASLTSKNIKKGDLIYTVNEKINAIAPKITDKGASTVQQEVNQTVVKTVSEIIFKAFNKVGIELDDQLPKLSTLEASLVEVKGKFASINKTVDLADDGTSKISDIVKDVQNDIPLIKETLNNSKNLSNDLKTFLQDSKGSLNKISPIIKNDLQMVADVSSNASKLTSDIIDAVNKGSQEAPILIDSLYNKVSALSSTNKTLIDFLAKLDKFTPTHPLEDVILKLESINEKLNAALSSLDSIKNQIANGNQPSLDNLNKILQVTNDVNNISTSVLNNFDSQISVPINNLFEQSFKVADDVIKVLENAEAKLPQVEDILNTSLSFSSSAEESIKFIKEKLPQAENMVVEIINALDKVNNSDDVSELVSLLKNDVLKESEFLKQPVNLVTNKLYPVENYGSGMTPFYTVLSLWVGVLLLVSLLSTNVHEEGFKSYQVYFGRGLTFLSIAIVQALIVSLGDLFLLKVTVINPFLLVVLSVFTSVVFTFIVYSLVSVFGAVGKATSVILLVIQVAASGGTFPIQVTPEFFQLVNPILPFTYAIDALRETVGGIYSPNLTRDIIALVIFMIVAIVFNVALKGPINRLMAGVRSKFNDSDLTGH